MARKIIGITTCSRKVNLGFINEMPITYMGDAILHLFDKHDDVLVVMIPTHKKPEDFSKLIGMLDALVLTPGEDLDPRTYREESQISYKDDIKGLGFPYERPTVLLPNYNRDLFELDLYHAAKDKGIPILGICRGMQLINVAEGGTLHQELPESHLSHFIQDGGAIDHHDVSILPGSRLHRALGLDTFQVTSIHHQAVKDLAPLLSASAHAEDGLIEAIEHTMYPHILGIQGHIEKIIHDFSYYEKIIDYFIESIDNKCLI